MARNNSKFILIKSDKRYLLDLEANRLNQVGKKGPAIIGASTDSSRDQTANTGIIYVDLSTGNDSTGDGTSGNPYKTYLKGVTIAKPLDKCVEWMDGSELKNPIVWQTQSKLGTNPILGEVVAEPVEIFKSTGSSFKFNNSRTGQGMANMGSYILMYGGWTGAEYVNFKQLYSGYKWEAIGGTKPGIRGYFSFSSGPSDLTGGQDVGRRAIFFGGTDDTDYYNDTWYADEFTSGGDVNADFIQLTPNLSPPARAFHASIEDDPSSTIFGGADGSGYYDDMWYFTYAPTVPVSTWTTYVYHNSPPSARMMASICKSDDGLFIYLFGGQDEVGYNNDIWVYSIDSGEWNEISTTGTPPSERQGMKMLFKNNKIYIYGGRDETDRFNDIFMFDILLSKWFDVVPFESPLKLSDYSLVKWKDFYYITGGISDVSGVTDTFYLFPVDQIAISGGQNKSATEALAMTLNGFSFKSEKGIYNTDWMSNCSFDNNKMKAFSAPLITRCDGDKLDLYYEPMDQPNRYSPYDGDIYQNEFTNLITSIELNFSDFQFIIKNNNMELLPGDNIQITYIQLRLETNLIKSTIGKALIIKEGSLSATDINMISNTIIGDIEYLKTNGVVNYKWRDNIIDLHNLFESDFEFIIESGNIRGSTLGIILDPIVSNLDPFFSVPQNGNYDLQRTSQGFASDSPLIAKAVYKSYMYEGTPYQSDLGCYDIRNAPTIVKWAIAEYLPLPKNGGISHFTSNDRKHNRAVSGRQIIRNNPDGRSENIVLSFLTLEQKYLTFIDQIESLTNMAVFISLTGQWEPLQTIVTNGIQAVDSFVIDIVANDVPIGSKFTYDSIDYLVTNRDTVAGDANQLVLNRKLASEIPDATDIELFYADGEGEFQYLIPEGRDLLQPWSRDPELRNGMELVFTRKKQ